MAQTAEVRAAAASKSTTKISKRKSPRAYPSFYEMISDAIVTLKEKTGSSQYAITRFIEEKHKKKLPSNFRKLLLVQLKKLVASDKLVKVKNSFKLPPARSAATKKPAAEKLKAAKSKPKPKTTKITAAAKPKPNTSVKAKPAAKKPTAKAAVKPKAAAKPAKVAKTAAIASPGKKVSKTKKAALVKSVKKPKSVKSPAAKKAAAKKAKK